MSILARRSEIPEWGFQIRSRESLKPEPTVLWGLPCGARAGGRRFEPVQLNSFRLARVLSTRSEVERRRARLPTSRTCREEPVIPVSAISQRACPCLRAWTSRPRPTANARQLELVGAEFLADPAFDAQKHVLLHEGAAHVAAIGAVPENANDRYELLG
jgi:hypothetical protein